jgi:hypothetical protein
MWVRGSSLQDLDSMLLGYRIALGVHGIEEPFDFWAPGREGAFTEWLWDRPGMPDSSSLGWATEIKRAAEKADRPAMEMFFELWDQFRAAGHGTHRVKPDGQASTEAEQPQQSD